MYTREHLIHDTTTMNLQPSDKSQKESDTFGNNYSE